MLLAGCVFVYVAWQALMPKDTKTTNGTIGGRTFEEFMSWSAFVDWITGKKKAEEGGYIFEPGISGGGFGGGGGRGW